MVTLSGFNANNVEPATDFSPIPEGKYLAVITESQEKPTKAQTGTYLELTFEIIEGEHKGRKIWSRLNINNPSAQAVQIAQSELSSICRAVGVMTPQDSAELHNLPLTITVKCKTREDNGALTNEIKGYAKKESAQGKPVQATSSVAPWARK